MVKFKCHYLFFISLNLPLLMQHTSHCTKLLKFFFWWFTTIWRCFMSKYLQTNCTRGFTIKICHILACQNNFKVHPKSPLYSYWKLFENYRLIFHFLACFCLNLTYKTKIFPSCKETNTLLAYTATSPLLLLCQKHKLA